MRGIAYLDASAFVKLVVPEPESAALESAVRDRWPHGLASEILTVEVARTAARLGGAAPAMAAERLHAVGLLPFTSPIREQAKLLGPPELRTLDAIHLATAVSVAAYVDVVLTYDIRLAAAARHAGLRVEAPA